MAGIFSHSNRNRRNEPPKAHSVWNTQYNLLSCTVLSLDLGSIHRHRVSAASSPPPATLPHHMTNPVQQKVGERSQRCASWIPGRENNRQCLQHADRQNAARLPRCHQKADTCAHRVVKSVKYVTSAFGLARQTWTPCLAFINHRLTTPVKLHVTHLLCYHQRLITIAFTSIRNASPLNRGGLLQTNKLTISGLRVCGVISSVPPTWSVRNGVTSVAALVATEDNLSCVVGRNKVTI